MIVGQRVCRESGVGQVGLLLEKAVEVGGGHGPCEVETLTAVTVEWDELIASCDGLDAFRHRGHAQAVGELDDRGHDGTTVGLVGEAGDEAGLSRPDTRSPTAGSS
jgi:hypothetical protein